MTQPVETAPRFPLSLECLDRLVRSLSIEERARLTSGIDAWHAAGAGSIGLGPMLTLDGPNGVRGMTFPRPGRELKGFSVVRLGPGETAEIRLTLDDRDFAYWDTPSQSWLVEPGRFEIQVGHSSRDIRLRRTFDLR